MTHKKFLSIAAVGVLALGLAACGDDDDDAPTTTAAPAASVASSVVATEAPLTTEAATDSADAANLGSNDQLVGMLQQQLSAAGITISDEQASCLANNATSIDPSDPQAAMAVFGDCDIDIAALAAAAG